MRRPMDTETRAYLADLRRRKRGMGREQVRARTEAAAQAEADAWNAVNGVRTPVILTDDHDQGGN